MKRPLLLGHRGVRPRGFDRLTSQLPTENSLAAFDSAMAHGCDGIEFDVRHTRDGRSVLWHDPECAGKTIAESDYAELRLADGQPLACLEDVLQRFGDQAFLDIELKVGGCEEAVLSALRQHPPRRYVVSSFLPDVLLRLRELEATLPLGFLCDRKEALSRWRELPVEVALPHYSLVTRELVAEVHGHGAQIMTWTVNNAEEMRRLAGWGIDGLISDDPRLLYQTFHSG